MARNLVCSFDLIPGLVVDLLGTPAIVTQNQRDVDTEVATVTFNTPQGDAIIPISWAQANSISVIGVTVDLEPDNVVLFDE